MELDENSSFKRWSQQCHHQLPSIRLGPGTERANIPSSCQPPAGEPGPFLRFSIRDQRRPLRSEQCSVFRRRYPTCPGMIFDARETKPYPPPAQCSFLSSIRPGSFGRPYAPAPVYILLTHGFFSTAACLKRNRLLISIPPTLTPTATIPPRREQVSTRSPCPSGRQTTRRSGG